MGHNEQDCLVEIVKDDAAVADAFDNRGKVVVRADDLGGLLGDLGAGDAHGDADIGALECGGVVHTVTCDGNHFAALLQMLDNHELVLGLHARKDKARLGKHGFPVFVLELEHILARVGALLVRRGLVAEDVDLLGNGLGGDGEVARDHDHLDAGAHALEHGLGNAFLGRVEQGVEPGKAEQLVHGSWELAGLFDLLLLGLVDVCDGEAEHALALGRKRGDLGLDVVLVCLGALAELGVLVVVGAAEIENDLWGALDHEQEGLFGNLARSRGEILELVGWEAVHGELPLVDAVEWNFGDLGVCGADSVVLLVLKGALEEPDLRCVRGEGHVGDVGDIGVDDDAVAEDEHAGELPHGL
eukprot:comp22286_c0_seq2/m.53250 comp22286_c0_seq2/g.53250  ORF comp22286_c0_seq2/g.53250 comp22286_c0_seq2/m.53250 type:complete len:357 (+) comp22286_c0_seq2:767-1837(+)